MTKTGKGASCVKWPFRIICIILIAASAEPALIGCRLSLPQAHVTARLLDRMSGKQSELEGRLDDMLSRIAMETQEIKELEQQLTDGEENTDQSQRLSQTGAF